MSEKIYLTLNVQVSGGPKISEINTIEVDAYDTINVTIEKDAVDKEVMIQPSNLDQVQFFLIKSDQYGDATNALTYKVGSSTDSITLDALQMLVGTGATKLFKVKPDKLSFTNHLGSNASVQILVGRKAT